MSLRQLLNATAGEAALQSPLGTWRRRISAVVDALVASGIVTPTTVPPQPTWTPLGDAGLVFWGEIDPVNLPGGYTLVGDTVSELIDLNGSGLKLTQVVASKRPTLVPGGAPSGLPSLHFDPTATQYLSASFVLQHPYHVFLSIRPVLQVADAYYFDGVPAGGSDDCYTSATQHGGNNVVIHVFGGGAVGSVGTVSWSWERWGAVFNGAGSKFKINDSQTTGVLATNDPGPAGFTLGARYNGTFPSQCDVQCVLIYNAEKTGSALANVEAYLKTKAGLAW